MITRLPELVGVTSHTEHPNGSMAECTVDEPNTIRTSCGALVPRFSRPDARSKELKSLSFYPSGVLRSISLDAQQTVKTPIGPFPAELVTFYETGEVDSVFPLNGQIGFGWTETEEKQLAQTYSFQFSFGTLTTKIISIRFYPTGEVKSLLLWPDDTVVIPTPMGDCLARSGIRVYPDGALESFEPAVPVDILTPIGIIRAYDVNALTVDGDENSVRFAPDGTLLQVATSGDIVVRSPEQGRVRISSRTRLALATDTPVKLSITLRFEAGTVHFDNGEHQWSFPVEDCRFLALPDIDPAGLVACDTDDCGTCGVACA
jgi:hypothetical protein